MKTLLALTLVLLLAVTGLAPVTTAADKPPIKIGFITPRTGNFAQMGIDMGEGFKLYLAEHDYTIAGRKVELIEEDEGATPATAVSKARKLVEHDKVHVMAGLLFAAAAYAVAPVVQEAEVPLVVTVAASDDLTQRKRSKLHRARRVHRRRARPRGGRLRLQEARLAEGLRDRHGLRLGPRDHGRLPARVRGARRQGDPEGVDAVNTNDFGPYVASLKPEADGILDVVTGAASIRLINEMRKAGLFDKKKVLAAGSATDETALAALGDSALGVLTFYPWSQALDTPENKRFVEKMKQATKKDYVGTSAALSYGAAMWIAEAIKNVGGDVENKEKFFKTLRATEIKSSPRGPIKIDKYGHIIQNVYIRRVDKVGGLYQNTVLETYPAVSQFFKYDPEEFLKQPVYGRDNPPCTHC